MLKAYFYGKKIQLKVGSFKMRFKNLFVAFAMTILPLTSFATDLPSKTSAPNAPVVATKAIEWTGLYSGVLIGLGSAQSQMDDGFASNPFDLNGSMFGVSGGYNSSMGNNLVLGIEADYTRSNVQGDFIGNIGRVGGGSWGCTPAPGCATELNWLATVRARMGYSIDNLMIFATAGAAYGQFHVNTAGSYIDATATNSAFVYGGGVEYRFDRNWSGKMEYLRTDLGWSEVGINGRGNLKDLGIFRFGLNHHF